MSDRTPSADRRWSALFERESEIIDGTATAPPPRDEAATEPPPPNEAAKPMGPGLSWRAYPPAKERIGLALSGGGIRSATFNLGVLQKLHELKILDRFDYLSTVSGGGYIGGFWSAWKSRPKHGDGQFPNGSPTGPEPAEIRHLREFSNFLRPRPRLLSTETGNITAGVVGAILPSVTVALSLLVLALSLWVLLARVVLGEPWSLPGLVPALVILAVTAAIQVSFEAHWRRHHAIPAPDSPADDGREKTSKDGRALPVAVVAAAVACVIAGGLWAVLWNLVPLPFETVLRPTPAGDAAPAAATVLLPCLAWIGTMLLLVTARVAFSRRVRTWEARSRKGALDRVISRVVLCAAAWAVLALVWVAGQRFAAEGPGWIVTLASGGGAASAVFAWARRLLGRQPNKPSGGKLRLLAGPWLLAALAYLVVAAISVSVASLLVYLGPPSLSKMVWAAGASVVVLVAAALLFDPQQNGFHAFYRQRLVRAYLGASNGAARDTETVEERGDDLLLSDLPARPFHLVCCAANDLAADPLRTLRRGADSAVLSKVGLQVGGAWKEWQVDATPTLGSAITASAAAFNSQMGSKSVRLGSAGTFLLGALGLRLGLWLESPTRTRRSLGRVFAWLQRHLPGLLYLRELAGHSHARSSWIHLSDGAHFENLALYELVRRHCRFILVCDCGADPDVAFDDFGNAVRRIREDFGVDVEIDLEPLRPNDKGIAAQPMVAGDIRYPAGDLGVLLYIKPTLVGDEPPDVAQYARRNDAFPHETTLDQFYDEAQWEAYRKLGEHIAERALGSLARRLDEKTDGPDDRVIRLLLRARYAWPPDGGDETTVTASVERGWTRLESRLEGKEIGALRNQLLPSPESDPATHPPEEVAAALPLVREALRLMETTILDTGMGARPDAPFHPRYMGWLNRFGRWTAAPLFRAWWPWLAPVHSQHVNTFLEATFGLPPVVPPNGGNGKAGAAGPAARPAIRELAPALRKGSTWSRWTESRSAEPTDSETLFGYFIPMPCVQGGELLVAVTAMEISKDRGFAVASWRRQELFVPPGMWGIGIGKRFLEALIAELKDRRVGLAMVESEDRPSISWEALYIGAGFERRDRDLILHL